MHERNVSSHITRTRAGNELERAETQLRFTRVRIGPTAWSWSSLAEWSRRECNREGAELGVIYDDAQPIALARSVRRELVAIRAPACGAPLEPHAQ